MNILITLLVSAVSVFTLNNFVPLKYLDLPHKERNLGATISTILGTDTLSSSRAVINTNFANLNSDKFETTGTTLASLTSAASLATVGTITSGTWNGGTIGVPYGGTGSTTLSSNQVLLGNGTGNIKTVNGLGSSGESLVSNGAGLAPTWQSVGVNQASNYTWTGLHTFSATTTMATTTQASSTITTLHTTTLNQGGIAVLPKIYVDSSGVDFSNTVTETTIATVSVTGGSLSTNNAIKIEIPVSQFSIAATNATFTLRLKYGATTIASLVIGGSGTIDAASSGYIQAHLLASGATNTQKGVISFQMEQLGNATTGWSLGEIASGTAAEDSTAAKTLAITGQFSSNQNLSQFTSQMTLVHLVR